MNNSFEDFTAEIVKAFFFWECDIPLKRWNLPPSPHGVAYNYVRDIIKTYS